MITSCLFTSCLFETEKDPGRPATTFDLSRLERARNPLAETYAVPEGKSIVGLQFAFRSMNYAWEVDSNVEAFHEQTGQYPAVTGAYFDLSSQPQNLKTFLDAVRADGCIPYVTLDPKDWDEPDLAMQKRFLEMILNGEFDAPLKALAVTLREFKHPVLFRYAHEMNGDWYPYAGGGDADGDGKADGPGKFIQAWRYVHNLFAQEGAGNLLWIFCPNSEDFPAQEWNRPFKYFPGLEYVDLIFVDGYEHHDKRSQSLEQSIAYFSNELGLYLESRAEMADSLLPAFGLGEFGTNRIATGLKTDWYVQSLDYLGEAPGIKFHIMYNSRNGREDFSLHGLGDRIKTAYLKSRFQFRLFGPQ
ncbi:MAG: glycosyl hydrolase [Fibrobacteria bacterium]